MPEQPTKPKKTMKFRRKGMSGMLMSYAATLNLFLSLRRRAGEEKISPVGALNSVAHLITAPAVLLLPIALLRRDFRLAGQLLVPALAFTRAYGELLARQVVNQPALNRAALTEPKVGEPRAAIQDTPANDGHDVGVRAFSLLTFNVHGESDPVHVESILHLIREVGADVVNLQEVSPQFAEAAANALGHIYPHRAQYANPVYHSAGMAVLSKYPITAEDYWQHPNIPNALGWQRAVLRLGTVCDPKQPAAEGKPLDVALYNCHPVHPLMVGRIFDAVPRAKEIILLLERAAQETLPTLLAGDFNLSDQADDYVRLTAKYRDVFRAVGRGMGFTFPDLSAPQARSLTISKFIPFVRPIVRLDYVFHDARFEPLEAQVWPRAAGSDHRPLLTRLMLLPGGLVKSLKPSDDAESK